MNLRARRLGRRAAAALMALALSASLAAQESANIKNSPAPPFLKGYLIFRYVYAGSAAPSTIGSGFRLTGSLRMNLAGDKLTFRYRSSHWIRFQTPVTRETAVLESPFENRHIFQTLAFDTNGLIAPGLKTTLGRFFPAFDYAALPALDGGAAGWGAGGFSISAAAGRMVDLWSGRQAGPGLFTAAQVRFRGRGFSLTAGYNQGVYVLSAGDDAGRTLSKKEIPVGAVLSPGRAFGLEAYAGYDLEAKKLARAGVSLSWRSEALSVSLLASRWTNPFEQLYILDQTRNYGTWGLYAGSVPAAYNDLRLSAAVTAGGWNGRLSFSLMSGARSGWTSGAAVTAPALSGIRLSLGAQAMRSDFIEFYSLDAGAEGQVGGILLRLQSQTRYYQWRPRESGFHNLDNFTELAAECALGRHVFLNAAGGGFIRRIGNEGFAPRAELRLIVRF